LGGWLAGAVVVGQQPLQRRQRADDGDPRGAQFTPQRRRWCPIQPRIDHQKRSALRLVAPDFLLRATLCACTSLARPALTAARELFLPFLVSIASTIPGTGPLYLSPNLDGWGVTAASDP